MTTEGTKTIVRIHGHISRGYEISGWDRDGGRDTLTERWETGVVRDGRLTDIVEFNDPAAGDWNKGAAEAVALRNALALEKAGNIVDFEFTLSEW